MKSIVISNQIISFLQLFVDLHLLFAYRDLDLLYDLFSNNDWSWNWYSLLNSIFSDQRLLLVYDMFFMILVLLNRLNCERTGRDLYVLNSVRLSESLRLIDCLLSTMLITLSL